MKLGSLFDGSGGFPLAGAIHGITPVWASEIEPYPIRVTKARFPQMKHLGSVLDVNGAEVEPVDIITFGSPCQDLSVAGKQAGLHKGERSNLFFEAIRIIKEMRESTDGKYPRIAVWENVPGAYSSNKGEDFRAVLEAFCSVKDEAADVPRPASGKWNRAGAIVGNGWSIAWRTFDAQFWGVPQRRKRIYLIADFGSERAGEILFEPESVRRDSAESGTAGEGAAGDAEGSHRGSCECLTPWDAQSKRIYREDSKWPGLCTGKRICDGSVLIFAADAERGAGGGCELVGFQSSQSGFRLCATHATLDANNGSRRQNGVCYPAPGGAEGSVGGSGFNGIFFKERAGCPGGGKGILCGDKPFTLSTLTDQAVCYAYDQYNGAISKKQPTLGANCGMSTGRNGVCYSVDCRNMNLTKEHGTLQAKENGGQSLNYMGAVCYRKTAHPRNADEAQGWEPTDKADTLNVFDNSESRTPMAVVETTKPPRKYIIRRLTPLECCRLQGFPDWWEVGVQGSDSARYKMWGNGIALPNATYVIGCAKKLIGATQ